MATWQLVVHSDPDVIDLGVSALRAARPGAVETIRTATHLLGAQRLVDTLGSETCDLLVVGASTPEDAIGDRGDPSRAPTQQFIRRLKRGNDQIQVIVLSAVPDQTLAGFLGAFDYTALIK